MQAHQVMRLQGFGLLFCSVMLVPGMVSAASYNCTMETGAGREGVPDQVLVEIAPDLQYATVQDAMTEQIDHSPLPVKLKSTGENRIALSWELFGVNFKGQIFELTSAKLKYRMNLNISRATFTYTGILADHGETIFGTGSCKRLK